MANNPQKAKDATEEALSAIQEALNVRESDLSGAAPATAAQPEQPRVETPKAEALRVEAPRVEASHAEIPRVAAPRVEPSPAAPFSSAADLFHQEPESTGWADEEPPRRQ